jgi:hypothetical protein
MEEGIETQELKEKLDEAAESAHGEEGEHGHGAKDGGGAGGGEKKKEEHHKNPTWIMPLSLSTALIAVFASVSSLESGALADDAIEWAWFQAKSTREALYASQAKIAAAVRDPDDADDFARQSLDEQREKDVRQKAAERDHARVLESDRDSEACLHRHHAFARSVTIFQVAIALSAVAALTKKKPVWLLSLGVGAFGLAFLVQGFLQHG